MVSDMYDVDWDLDAKHVRRDNRVCSLLLQMATRTRPVANVKTTKEAKGATFDDEAGVRTLQCQFHKPQSLVAAGGGETNYDGSRMTIILSCVAKLAQIVEIKDTTRL